MSLAEEDNDINITFLSDDLYIFIRILTMASDNNLSTHKK